MDNRIGIVASSIMFFLEHLDKFLLVLLVSVYMVCGLVMFRHHCVVNEIHRHHEERMEDLRDQAEYMSSRPVFIGTEIPKRNNGQVRTNLNYYKIPSEK